MPSLFLIIFSLFFIFLPKTQAAKPIICQFHLNKAKSNKNKVISAVSNTAAEVKNFYPEGDQTGKEAFIEMISGKENKCDGLVISGHHTGDFFDKNKKLSLKDMEKLSCNKKYRGWFKNIKSLWMLGCNTVTDKYIKNNPKGKRTANSQTLRLLGDDYSEGSTIGLQHAYSGSLDEFTPLSSRYLRMFPETKIYGFDSAAPLNEIIKDTTIVSNHIKNIAAALKAEDESLNKKNPKQVAISAINALFDPNYCEKSLSAWEGGHGNARSIENQDFKEAYRLGCALIKAKQVLDNPKSSATAKKNAQKEILKTLTTIDRLDNPEGSPKDPIAMKNKYSQLLFNNIYETWKLVDRTGDKKFKKKLQKKFKSKDFSEGIEDRLGSSFISAIRQVDLLNFYKEIHTGDKNKMEFINKKVADILNNKVNLLFQNDYIDKKNKTSDNEKVGRTLSLAVIDQLLQYDLLTHDQKSKLFNNKTIFHNPKENKYTNRTHWGLLYNIIYYGNEEDRIKSHEDRNTKVLSTLKEVLDPDNISKESDNLHFQITTKYSFKNNDTNFLSKVYSAAKEVDYNDTNLLNKRGGTAKQIKNKRNIITNEVSTLLNIEYPDDYEKQSAILQSYMEGDENLKTIAITVATGGLFPCKQKMSFIKYMEDSKDSTIKKYAETMASVIEEYKKLCK